MHDSDTAVENKHLHMNKNNKKQKNFKTQKHLYQCQWRNYNF